MAEQREGTVRPGEIARRGQGPGRGRVRLQRRVGEGDRCSQLEWDADLEPQGHFRGQWRRGVGCRGEG